MDTNNGGRKHGRSESVGRKEGIGRGSGGGERGVTDLENSGLRKIKGNNLWDTQWLDENQEDLG